MTGCTVDIREEADVAIAISRSRRLLDSAGIRTDDVFRITTAVAELGRNIVKYADRGTVTLRLERTASGLRVRLVADDEGPGISDVDSALQDGFTTGSTLGMGLPGVRRLMDDFAIDSTLGVGTRITCHRTVVER